METVNETDVRKLLNLHGINRAVPPMGHSRERAAFPP